MAVDGGIIQCFGRTGIRFFFMQVSRKNIFFLVNPAQTGIIGNLGDPGGKLGLEFKTGQVVEYPEVDILGQVLTVLSNRDHLKNNLGDQVFCIFYNDPKCPVISAQNPVNQLLICRIMSDIWVHVNDETGRAVFCSDKTRLFKLYLLRGHFPVFGKNSVEG